MTVRPLPVLLAAGLLSGCAARRPAAPDAGPFAWKATLSLTIQAPRWDLAATVPAALVVRRPDVLFLQVRGPIGGPVAEVCTDRAGASVLLHASHRLLVEADPDAAVAGTTGGALGLDGLLALLLGAVPSWDAESDGTVPLPEGRLASFAVDPRGRLAAVRVRDAAGGDLFQATWEGWSRREGTWRPGATRFAVPPLDLEVRARFLSWETLGSLPVTCAHALPGGGPEGFVREGLREARSSDGATPGG